MALVNKIDCIKVVNGKKAKKSVKYRITVTNRKLHNEKKVYYFNTLKEARAWCLASGHVYHYQKVEW